MNIRQTIFSTIIAIILTLFILIFFLLKPLLVQIQKLSQVVEQQQIIVKNPAFQEQYQARIASIEADYQAIEPRLSILKQSILEKEEAIRFIEILENTAQQTHLTQEIKIKPASLANESEQKEQKNILIFSLSLVGDFSNFLRFLEMIENNQYLLQVQKIQIKALRDKEKQLTGQVQSNVEIKVYIHQ